MIEVRRTEDKGRGVFATCAIPADTIIEIAPVIVMDEHDRKLLDQTRLHDYIFEWGDDETQCGMALGFVPIYNHSYESNCEYEMDFENEVIRIKTMRDIPEGTELTVNYNGDWNARGSLWFKVR